MSWIDVCEVARIPLDTGVCALVDGRQVAVFRLRDFRVVAVSNHDPLSGANVLSRGIVGDKGGRLTVASPVYKQRFDLETGECLDDPGVSIDVYPARLVGGIVQVSPPSTAWQSPPAGSDSFLHRSA